MLDEKIDSESWTVGRASGYARMITLGVRDVAHITVHKNHMDAVIKGLKEYRIKTKIFPHADVHFEVYLYRYVHSGKIIEYLHGDKSYEKLFHHWCMGKLFGYSEKEIGKFLKKLEGELCNI